MQNHDNWTQICVDMRIYTLENINFVYVYDKCIRIYMYTHTCICTYIYMYVKILAAFLVDANDYGDGRAWRGEGSRNFLDSIRLWGQCDERRCLGIAAISIKGWGRLGSEGSEKLRGRGVGDTMCVSLSVISYITFSYIYLSYFILLDIMYDTSVLIHRLYIENIIIYDYIIIMIILIIYFLLQDAIARGAKVEEPDVRNVRKTRLESTPDRISFLHKVGAE